MCLGLISDGILSCWDIAWDYLPFADPVGEDDWPGEPEELLVGKLPSAEGSAEQEPTRPSKVKLCDFAPFGSRVLYRAGHMVKPPKDSATA